MISWRRRKSSIWRDVELTNSIHCCGKSRQTERQRSMCIISRHKNKCVCFPMVSVWHRYGRTSWTQFTACPWSIQGPHGATPIHWSPHGLKVFFPVALVRKQAVSESATMQACHNYYSSDIKKNTWKYKAISDVWTRTNCTRTASHAEESPAKHSPKPVKTAKRS